jgi:hypothetical protein
MERTWKLILPPFSLLHSTQASGKPKRFAYKAPRYVLSVLFGLYIFRVLAYLAYNPHSGFPDESLPLPYAGLTRQSRRRVEEHRDAARPVRGQAEESTEQAEQWGHRS